MKSCTMMFTIALLVMVLASLGGCASQKFGAIEEPITIGDKTYTALYTKVRDPWGTNATSTHLVQSDHEVEAEQPQCVRYAPSPVQQVQPCPPPHHAPRPPQRYSPQARHDQHQQKRPPYTPAPQPPPCCCQRCQPQVVVMSVYRQKAQLVNTKVVNNNNQGGDGWVNGAFKGAVGDALMGGSIMGGAALIRPSRVTMTGGGGAASSSAASSSAAAAAAGS